MAAERKVEPVEAPVSPPPELPIRAKSELPRYGYHKVVQAVKIEKVKTNLNGAFITGEGFGRFFVSHDYMLRHDPVAGGYYVRYDDGYESFLPAKVFESVYAPEPS